MHTLLSGYRALDLTDEKGMLCGKILADIGVDVIKVERPRGDTARRLGPFFGDEPDPEKSLFWLAFNNNKRGITLNIESEEGQGLLKKLAERADFIIESFDPGYLDSMNLGYYTLSQINPRVILISITPFGQTGPYASYKGSDLTVFAMGSLMSQCGDPDRAPVQVSFPQSYINASLDAAQGTMVAHYYRELTGEGQQVDVAAIESVAYVSGQSVLQWPFTHKNLKRAGSLQPRQRDLEPPTIWQCKDGSISFFLQGGQPGARNNSRLVKWMEEEGVAPNYLITKKWLEFNWDTMTKEELKGVLGPFGMFFKSHTVNDIFQGALKRDISLLPVNTIDRICEDPQLDERGYWVEIDSPEPGRSIKFPGPWAAISETPIRDWRRAPMVGEHNKEVYQDEMGMTSDHLSRLRSTNVI